MHHAGRLGKHTDGANIRAAVCPRRRAPHGARPIGGRDLGGWRQGRRNERDRRRPSLRRENYALAPALRQRAGDREQACSHAPVRGPRRRNQCQPNACHPRAGGDPVTDAGAGPHATSSPRDGRDNSACRDFRLQSRDPFGAGIVYWVPAFAGMTGEGGWVGGDRHTRSLYRVPIERVMRRHRVKPAALL